MEHMPARQYGNNLNRVPQGTHKKKKRRKRRRRVQPRFFLLLFLLLLVIALGLILGIVLTSDSTEGDTTGKPVSSSGKEEKNQGGIFSFLQATPEPTPVPTPEPTPEPTPTPKFDIPHAVSESNPANWGYTTNVEVNGAQVSSYQRTEPIHFEEGYKYTGVDGIVTFRGNNYRSTAAYGSVSSSISGKLSKMWNFETGSMLKPSGSGTWSGSGWVGQPLVVRWPASTKRIMNMYDWAKQKDGLVEGILACLNGTVYFFDIETGRATRDPLEIGIPFKGAGALDPRGYPIMYLGSGDNYPDDPTKTVRAVVYSLVDFKCLYSFGAYHDSFAIRDWHAYDSSPLVDAETDTLIYPGENGIIYTIKLNTHYDEAAGTLSMSPSDVVKFRYNTSRSTPYSTSEYKYWMGYEDSAVIWDHYIYLATNDGFVQCIDLNTMQLIWANDCWDDTNGSIILEEDEANRTAYLYVGNSLHFTADKDKHGTVALFKLDAVTGEILWHHDEGVYTRSGVSGGIQATAILGEKSISDLVIVPFARTPDTDHGYLMAIDKQTGETRWKFATDAYSWSSPVAVYDENGKAYVINCDNTGHIFLLDGQTGTLLNKFDAERNIEASPVVYGDTMIIGTRGMKVWGIKIS